MKQVKGFILGFITCAIIAAGTMTVIAATNTLEVSYSVDDIKINTVSKMPDQKPLVHNGTTYVPVRFISEALGYPVHWEAESRTIWIGKREEAMMVYPGNGIEHMNYQSSSYHNAMAYKYNSPTTIKDNIGNEYSSYLTLHNSLFGVREASNYLEFPLNGDYDRFKATVGLTDDHKSSILDMKLTIYLDDQEVYNKSIKAGIMPEDIDLDVKNAIKMKIEFASTGRDLHNSEIGLFNAYFTR